MNSTFVELISTNAGKSFRNLTKKVICQHLHIDKQGLFWPKIFVREKSQMDKFSVREIFRFSKIFLSLGQNV